MVICIYPLQGKEKSYVANDNIDTEGWRFVSSIYENLYATFSTGAAASLKATVSPANDTTFYLQICFNEGKLTMDEGSILLLKLGDGSNIELHSNKVGLEDIECQITKYGTHYYIYPMYEITTEQIEKIINQDVIKIRVQCTGGTFDREIKKQKLSKLYSKAYPAVIEVLSQNKSVYDNF